MEREFASSSSPASPSSIEGVGVEEFSANQTEDATMQSVYSMETQSTAGAASGTLLADKPPPLPTIKEGPIAATAGSPPTSAGSAGSGLSGAANNPLANLPPLPPHGLLPPASVAGLQHPFNLLYPHYANAAVVNLAAAAAAAASNETAATGGGGGAREAARESGGSGGGSGGFKPNKTTSIADLRMKARKHAAALGIGSVDA